MKQLLVFKARWCNPCSALTTVLQQTNLPIDKVVSIDVDDNIAAMKEYSIRGVPTLILHEDGVELRRTTGFQGPNKLVEFCTT